MLTWECIMYIDLLLGSLPNNHELRSICICFSSLLPLTEGNIRCLVNKVQNASHRSSRDNVIVQLIILIDSSTNQRASGYGLVRKKFLNDTTIIREVPGILNTSNQIFMVGFFTQKRFPPVGLHLREP
jgi:hypothetical protein